MDAHWQGEPGFGTTTGKEDSPTRKISQIVLNCSVQCSSWRSHNSRFATSAGE